MAKTLITLGIDLGARNTRLAIVKNGDAKVLQHIDGEFDGDKSKIISAVCYREHGTIVGKESLRNPAQYVIFDAFRASNVEQQYGAHTWHLRKNNDAYSVNETNIPQQQVVQDFLSWIIEETAAKLEVVLEDVLFDVVISVPDLAPKNYVSMLEVAIKNIKSISNFKLLKHTEAATIAFAAQEGLKDQHSILVVNVGAASIVVSAFQRNSKDEDYKVISRHGDVENGADAVTTKMVQHYILKLRESEVIDLTNINESTILARLKKLWEACEKAKTELAKKKMSRTKLLVDFFDQEYTDWVTREDIDNYSQVLFDQLQRCIENVKAEAGSSFDIVLLVGGGSRMFQIEGMVEELLPSCNFYPPFLSIRDEIIAMGCAIKASSEYENRKEDASLSNGQQEKDILPQKPLNDVSLLLEVPPKSSSTSDAYEANLHSEKLTNSGSTPRLSDNTVLPMKQPDLVFIRREQSSNVVLPPKIEVIPRSEFVSSAENLSDQEKIQRFRPMSDESTKAKEKTNLNLDSDFPEKVELIQKPENNNNANTTNKESYRYILIDGTLSTIHEISNKNLYTPNNDLVKARKQNIDPEEMLYGREGKKVNKENLIEIENLMKPLVDTFPNTEKDIPKVNFDHLKATFTQSIDKQNEPIDKHDLVMKEIKVEQNKYANFPIKRSASDDSSNAKDVKGIHKSNPTDPIVNMIPFGKLELNKTVEKNTRKFDSQSQTIKPEREVTRFDSKTKLSQTIQPKNHKSMNDNLLGPGIALSNLNAPNPNEEETTKRFEENFKKFNQPLQKGKLDVQISLSSQQEKIDSIKATKNIKKSDNLPYTGVTKYQENFIKSNTKSSSPSSSTPRITEKRVPSDSSSLNSQQEKIDSIKVTKNTKKSDNLPYTGVTKYKENFMKPNTKSSSPSSVTTRRITVPSDYFPFKSEAVGMANIQKSQLKKAHSTSEKYAVMNYNMKDSSKSSLTNSDSSLNNNNQRNIEATTDHFKRQAIYETIKAYRDEVSSFKYISVNEQNAFDEAYSVKNLNHIDTENLSKKLVEAHKDKERLHKANKFKQERNGIYLQKYGKIQQIINTANNDQPLEMLKYKEALEFCVKITREAYTKTIKEPSGDNEIFEKYILDIYASRFQNNLKESILAVLNLDDRNICVNEVPEGTKMEKSSFDSTKGYFKNQLLRNLNEIKAITNSLKFCTTSELDKFERQIKDIQDVIMSGNLNKTAIMTRINQFIFQLESLFDQNRVRLDFRQKFFNNLQTKIEEIAELIPMANIS